MSIRGLGEVYSGGPHARGDLTTDGRRAVSGHIAEFFDSDPLHRDNGQHATLPNRIFFLTLLNGFISDLSNNVVVIMFFAPNIFPPSIWGCVFHRNEEKLSGKAGDTNPICLSS